MSLGDVPERTLETDRLSADEREHGDRNLECRCDKVIHVSCERITERLRRLIDQEGLDRIVLAAEELLPGELEEHLEDRYRGMIVAAR